MSDDVPVVRDLPADLSTPPPEYVPASERATFKGFRRRDGRVGARVFEHVRRVASGEMMAKAEEHKHREFQFWAEQTVSL